MKTLCFTLLCKNLSHHFFSFVVCIHGANFNSLPLSVTLQVVLLYWSSNHINLSLRVLWRLSDVIFIVHCAFFEGLSSLFPHILSPGLTLAPLKAPSATKCWKQHHAQEKVHSSSLDWLSGSGGAEPLDRCIKSPGQPAWLWRTVPSA